MSGVMCVEDRESGGEWRGLDKETLYVLQTFGSCDAGGWFLYVHRWT